MADPLLIAQISDLHVNADGAPGVAGRDAEAPARAAVAHLMALDPSPDAVIATGDLAATVGAAEEYARLAACLSDLDLPLYLIPGNHDDRAGLRAAFPDHGYLPPDGFLHYVVDLGSEDWLRLIGLDTLQPGATGGELCEARLDWLRARLDEAPRRPTLILMHHPPAPIGVPSFDKDACIGGGTMAEILRSHPQVLTVTCGHVHRASQQPWAGVNLVTCPSTLVQANLALGADGNSGWGDDPAACLLHYWIPDTEAGAGRLISHVSFIG